MVSKVRYTAAALLLAVTGCRVFQRSASPSFPATDIGTLSKADRLAKLGNWEAAGPIYADLEQRFARKHDVRNQYYAHVSRYGLEEESSDLLAISEELKNILQCPIVQNDLQLKQRCLEIKAHIDLNLDGVSSRPSLEELEKVAATRKDADAVSRASGELGILAFLEANPREARNRVMGAIVHSIASGDSGAQIRYLSLLGQGLVQSHKAKEALWPLDHALAIARRTPDAGFPSLVISGRASALTQLGRFAEAQTVIDEGLRYAQSHHYTGFQVEMLAQAGLLAAKRNQILTAIALYENAALLARQIRFNRGLAEINSQLASLYQRIGKLPEAVAAEQASIDAHLKMGEVYELPHHLALKADLQRALGLNEPAKLTYTTAEQVVSTMLNNSPTAGVKRSVISSMSEVYVGHFHLAEAEHDFPEAYRIIEEARGRVAADRLRSPEEEKRPRPEIAAAERQIVSLEIRLFNSQDRLDRAKIADQITATEQQTPFEDSGVHLGAPLAVRNLQASLQPNEAVLEYVLDDPGSFCLVIQRRSINLVRLTGKAAIAALVDQELAAVKSRSLALAEGRALYSAVMQPVERFINGANLIVVPDGELNRVALAALVDTQGRYLLQTRSIDYTPSGTVLTVLRGKQSQTQSSLLAVGNVEYGQEAKPVQRFSLLRGLDALTRRGLQPLPASQAEIQSVATTMHDLNGIILSGRTATESNFKREAGKNAGIIHLAVHAFADKEYPDRAGLVFAASDRGEDGILQVREIRRLHMNRTALVTLSACDTSIGRIEGEEGVSSVVSAFLYAGARTAISSLWSIEDSSTSELMTLFYAELAQGNTASAALRTAQLELLRRGDETKAPFFWAAFELTGEGSGTIGGGAKK